MVTPVDFSDLELPIMEIVPQLKKLLGAHTSVIIGSPPGAGKSTIVPLVLLEESWLQGRKIVMLEPRRLAASTIAHRMAALLGEKAGETVGYRVRFENQTSPQTRIEVVTEGILTRMLHNDNALEDVGAVIFDEFHERRLHTDLSLALCRESQQILRPDLRILIMSATLDMTSLTELLGAPAVESQGRMYPVTIVHTGDPVLHQLPEHCARTIIRACREQHGDILAFLPGEAEIRTCEQLLLSHLTDAAVHPLYGQLPLAAQHAAIKPERNGRRKIVLATSIAETSLTIEGIRIIVDCGYTRTMVYDPQSGLSRLRTVRISRDAADQRAGRAGRLGPGTCYRMWTNATEHRMANYRAPEILHADLTSLVLDTVKWGLQDATHLGWVTPPPSSGVAQATNLLHKLGALHDGRITEHGQAMHALPCHPRIAHMLLESQKINMSGLAADIAALLEERDPFGHGAGVDINLRIEAMRRHRTGDKRSKRFDNLEKTARSYRKMLRVAVDNYSFDSHSTGRLLTYAYPDRIAKQRNDGRGTFQLAGGKRATVPQGDDLAEAPWLAIASLDARDGLGKIFLASSVDPVDLAPHAALTERIVWDTKKGGIQATRDMRLGAITFRSSPLLQLSDEAVMPFLHEAIRTEGAQLLHFSEPAIQWQNRVSSLRHWHPAYGWPDVRLESLLQHPATWLAPYLHGVRKVDDLKKLDMQNIFEQMLSYEQQGDLNRLAPAAMKVPSGSIVKLQYSPVGEPPILAVRLQEVFGLLDTPRVNDNQMPVLLHLLSPGFKPVQVTRDLHSFWQDTYYEVRKELRRRYPKHAWPADPLQATGIRGVPKNTK